MIKIVIGKNKAIASGMSFILITDENEPQLSPFAQSVITSDGHPMTNPSNNNWCINDTYPDEKGIRTLMLYNFEKDVRINLGNFQMIFNKPDMTLKESFFSGVDSKILKMISQEQLAFTRSGLHCDLHPRWNADGTIAFFDSIHEGTRQIYAVEVEKIINNHY